MSDPQVIYLFFSGIFFFFFLGTGKTRGFVDNLLPNLVCEGGVFVVTSDPADFQDVSLNHKLSFLPRDFQVVPSELEKLPPNSLCFYGEFGFFTTVRFFFLSLLFCFRRFCLSERGQERGSPEPSLFLGGGGGGDGE